MTILGIETSCDETAAAVVQDGKRLLSNVVFSSMDLHKAYGGVVPEIAARSHVEAIMPVIEQALADAFSTTVDEAWEKIDAIAVTYGAGLSGSLLVGVMTARTIAKLKEKPLYGINHVEAHVYANFLTEAREGSNNLVSGKEYKFQKSQPDFPALALIVSGGHSQLALFWDHFDYVLLGQTRDDAVGEAFDKVAKITGLPYPGGPSIAQAATHGDDHKYSLPKARLEGVSDVVQKLRQDGRGVTAAKHGYDFSFSGLKTAVLRRAQELIGEDFTFPSHQLAERLTEEQVHDIAASFQRVALETLVDKTVLAYEEFQPKSVIIAGGVAASHELRKQLTDRVPIAIDYPDMKLCTDNGAMIATLGCYKAMLGQSPTPHNDLEIDPNLTM